MVMVRLLSTTSTMRILKYTLFHASFEGFEILGGEYMGRDIPYMICSMPEVGELGDALVNVYNVFGWIAMLIPY